jgi:hypothetical protein
VRAAHTGVDDVRVDTGAVGARDEAPVERCRTLIDAIESPGDLSGA